MTGKRKRGDAFSVHEKMVHKSCSLLQREAKKVRTFLVRKVVQQLKQLRQQLDEPVQDAAKQQKREQKLRHSIAKLEREHTVLKALDLRNLVDRARQQTGLEKLPIKANEHEVASEWDEQSSDCEAKRSNKKEDNEQQVEEKNIDNVENNPDTEQLVTWTKEQDRDLEEKLMDRVLSHKQIVPVLEAIKKLVEKEEKENAKKRRAQEKRALKRGRHESLVGNTGRSGVAPTSLFLGSLSGRGEEDDSLDMSIGGYGTIAGADDDIAEFLGEKKKRKNRPGQVARRMKAIRKEEAKKRQEDRGKGIFVPFNDNSKSASKYGRSERPKKIKEKVKPIEKDRQQPRGGLSHIGSKEKRALRTPATPVESAHPSWLAKQKQKEKEKISLTAFKGKKITFD